MKRYLAEQGVRYELKNLNTDPAAREEFRRAGIKLPPVLVIDGIPVEGFQPDRIDALLHLDPFDA
ncbi:MAG: glutaredoxin family protein [Dehalococcoidia bacterium]